jgi:hypothetical protein
MYLGREPLPASLLHSLALSLLRSQHCLTLGFGLAGDFSKSIGLGLARGFSCLSG